MGDPTNLDPALMTGASGAGGLLVWALGRVFTGSGLAGVERSIEHLEKSLEQRLASIEKAIEKNEKKYDDLNREFGVLQRSVDAQHRRGDVIEHTVADAVRRLGEVEDRLRRIGSEVAR